MKKKQNLLKRGSIYYARAMIGTKERVVSLKTTDAEKARELAKPIIAAWKRDHLFEQNGVTTNTPSSKKEAPTVGEMLEIYRTEATAYALRNSGKPRPGTIEGVANAIVRVVKGSGVTHPESLSITKLDASLLTDYADAQLAASTNPDRTRGSVGSTITQARSVFAKWARRAYKAKHVNIPPNIADFLEAEIVHREPKKYVYPPLKLVESTEKNGAQLREQNKDLWLAYVLAFAAGLRAGEIAAARWDWIHVDGKDCRLSVRQYTGWKTKNGHNREIRLHPDTAARIMELKAARAHIIPGETFLQRKDVVTRDLSEWLRKIGWDAVRYPKASHELRKLAGARWYTAHGLSWAAKWLGDREDTAYKFYVDLDPRTTPMPAAVG